MIIQDFKAFIGQHCETTATGSLLLQLGLDFSESMLFGLGEGLGFIFWNMKSMDFPFIGGRVKPDVLTENICRNLNLTLQVHETSSLKKAWEQLSLHLNNSQAVGLKLDCYHLDYFSNPIHFAGHYVAMYGYDEEYAYLVDTKQQGSQVITRLKSLELARNEKGPMSSRNKSYTISKNGELPALAQAVKTAIINNSSEYLNPPIRNIAYKGILKLSKELPAWFHRTDDIKRDFQTSAMLMERAGTGGALFRNLYRDFLAESFELTGLEEIGKAHQDFVEIARQWTQVSQLFHQSGETKNFEYLKEASEILKDLSESERKSMTLLKGISQT